MDTAVQKPIAEEGERKTKCEETNDKMFPADTY